MDEYLKTLLEQIRCKKARPYVKQEFQDHIEDQIEANMQAGMDREQAEREAVRDMGDPVETGISLDSVHRPQVAWKLLGIIVLISIAGVLIHAGIVGKITENAAAGSDRYVFHVLIGLAVMMILYLLDYTVLARFSKIIAVILLFVCLITLLGGCQINGARYFIVLPGGRGISMQTLMLFYVPIYGAILYKYHGWGYKGLMRAIIWMIAPVILVCAMPAFMTACVMLVSVLVMLTIAIQKNWFTVRKRRAICGIWAGFLAMPVAAFLIRYLRSSLTKYQIARVQAIFSGGGEKDYFTGMLHSFWQQNKWIGKSESDVMGNLGIFPQSVTFLPFLSAGGSCIIVSYGLMGIVLSTYRYKNIYPWHLKIGFKFDKTKARKALYVSKMSMCILTGGTVVVMCVAIYWDLCKSYMNIPFKIITIVLILLLVGNMRKIVQHNEVNR